MRKSMTTSYKSMRRAKTKRNRMWGAWRAREEMMQTVNSSKEQSLKGMVLAVILGQAEQQHRASDSLRP
jgi:hypothetical protein